MLPFLRALILAVGLGAPIGSGFLGGVAWGQSTPTGFSLIPGGSFTMGRTSGDTDADAPSITVTVSPFYIQQTETTKAQWDEVRTWAVSNGYTDLGAGAGKASNHPVQTVSWWDVVKWCNARSEKEGLTPVYTVSGAVMRTGTTAPTPNWSANGYRLPTEAEWEKAAQVIGDRYASVGSIWEWCQDWYDSTYYAVAPRISPQGPPKGQRVRVMGIEGPTRVIRGGGYGRSSLSRRVTVRSFFPPDRSRADLGFRVVRESGPAPRLPSPTAPN